MCLICFYCMVILIHLILTITLCLPNSAHYNDCMECLVISILVIVIKLMPRYDVLDCMNMNAL